MPNPKVSIVIPVYNPTQYLNEVLESAQKQTFKDFEVVISDDTHKAETTQNIIKDFAGLTIRYQRSSKPKGIFNNLNSAIENSSGEFIQIFCQDDVMKADFLEEQLKMFERYTSAGLVFCDLDEIDAAGKLISSISYFTEPRRTWSSFLPKEKAFNYLFAFGCIPRNLSPVMFRRAVIEKTGLFKQDFSFAGDYDYWIRVAEQFDFVFNKERLLYVRSHGERASYTIGLPKLIPDATTLYRIAYCHNTVTASKYKQYLQVNNLVAGYFKDVVKGIVSGRFRYFKVFRYFHSFPFHIPTILFIILHRYYRHRVSWFVKETDC